MVTKNAPRKRRAEASDRLDSSEAKIVLDDRGDGDEEVENPVPASGRVPEDDKVFHALKKLSVRQNEKKKDNSRIEQQLLIILSLSEASYFTARLPVLVESLQKNLNLRDLHVSKPVDGSVDRFITLYGDCAAICKSAIYISFCLNAKVNYIPTASPTPLYTLKSPNYNLTVLHALPSKETLKEIAGKYKLKVFDYSDSYNRSNSLSSIFLRGDFNSIFNSLATVLQETTPVALDGVVQLLVVGTYGNPSLFQRQEKNNGVLNKLLEEIILYIYK